MSTRKSTFFYAILLTLASVVAGMVLAARLDLTPASLARTVNVPATNAAPLDGPVDASTFRNIAKEASPTVVSIRITGQRQNLGPAEMFQLPTPFGRRRGAPESQEGTPYQGAGSGFIIDKAGYILTNNHVVEDATAIEVKLANMDNFDRHWLPAKVVGRDALTDVALIQLTELPKDGLAESRFGDSAALGAGDWVMAIGNPFSLSNTVTVGVVSAVGRPQLAASNRWEKMIQTDAAINQGNSGGPLLNVRGEVVGINTMIVSDQGRGNLGIGFAVPINTVVDILPQLRTGKVTRGRIGVEVDRVAMSEEDAADLGVGKSGGALVSGVPAGPAREAGIKLQDVIVEFNGQAVGNSDELVTMVARTTPNTTVPVKIVRDKRPVTLNIKVAELNLAEESGVAETEPRSREPRTAGYGIALDPLQVRQAEQLRVPSSRGGAIVADVEPFSPADQGGLRPNDVILGVQGQETRTVDAVSQALDQVPSGRLARIIVWRSDGRTGREILVQVRKR